MGAKTIILCYITPMRIDHFRPCFSFTDPVPPMILIAKATSRPAKVGYFYFLQCFYNVQPDPVFALQCGCIADPVTIIDTPAEVFGEMAIDVFINRKFALVRVDGEFVFLAVNAGGKTQRGDGEKEVFQVHDKLGADDRLPLSPSPMQTGKRPKKDLPSFCFPAKTPLAVNSNHS